MLVLGSICVLVTDHQASVKYRTLFSACSIAADKMVKSCSEVVFLVDMNIDMLQNINNKNLHSPTNPLADFCDQFCLTNTIVKPTGMTRTSKTLIDVILVNQPERWATSGTLQLGTSDHDLVYIVRKQRLPKPKANVIESRSMKHFNVDAFLADLATTPWDTTFVYDDIDDIWAHWSKLYNDTIKNHAPTIKKIVQTSPNPWINVHIKKAMRMRNKLYRKYRRCCTDAS